MLAGVLMSLEGLMMARRQGNPPVLELYILPLALVTQLLLNNYSSLLTRSIKSLQYNTTQYTTIQINTT